MSSPSPRPPLGRALSLYRPPVGGGSRVGTTLEDVAAEFDGPPGNLTESLLQALNRRAAADPALGGGRLEPMPLGALPAQVILIDASPNHLPLSPETCRVARQFFRELGASIPVHVVNRREELLARLALDSENTLVLSQCASRQAYDQRLALELAKEGVAVVPGPLTAPGGVLSDKLATYDLLSRGGGEPLVPPYAALASEGEEPSRRAAAILEGADRLSREWSCRGLFFKPPEGGGGLGCFQLGVRGGRYFLPDLSRLAGRSARVCPYYPPFSPDDPALVAALAWVFRRFERSPLTARAYLALDRRGLLRRNGTSRMTEALAQLLREGKARGERRHLPALFRREEALGRLSGAIERFQSEYGRPYLPLAMRLIEFGLWALRIHLRLGREGVVAEAIYGRLFPLCLTEEGVGYVGVDSISNPQSGEAELNRYTPLSPPLVEAVGGREALLSRALNAFRAFRLLLQLLPPGERRRLPVRAEFDMSPVSGLIVEGNADPVRGHTANCRWGRFVEDARAWIRDALAYYSWRKSRWPAS